MSAIALEHLAADAARHFLAVDQVDVCVIVPKADEFRAHLDVFGTPDRVENLPCLLADGKYPFATATLNDLFLVIALMNGQGNTASGICARDMLRLLTPAHIYLSGTSLGNKNRTNLGSVRVADRVQHAAEWVTNANERLPRWKHYNVPSAIRRDLGSYIEDVELPKMVQTITTHLQSTYPRDWEQIYSSCKVDVEMSPIASDNELWRANGERIWSYEERFSSYDMESGGFAQAVDGESGVNWAVVRGISDFGADKEKSEGGVRTLAAAASAAFIRLFLLEGISKSHPSAMRPKQVPTGKLSPKQHYNLFSASNFFGERIRQDLHVELPVSFLNRQLTLEDLANYCVSQGHEHRDVIAYLKRLRVEYFESKYVDYTYDVDIRGYWAESWFQEFREFIALWGRESLSRSHILDVGCGNGLELPVLFAGARRVTGVDLSERMLSQARQRGDNIETIRSEAENLTIVMSESVDMYVSLRTYMSRFFDSAAALRNAWRVLRPGGLIVLSIAAGYLDEIDGKQVVVKGLKEVNGSEFVDADRPLDLAATVFRQINALGFELAFISSRLTDVYVGALKPGGSVPYSPRLESGSKSKTFQRSTIGPSH